MAVRFYKDEKTFLQGETCSALLPLDNSVCEEAIDYHKRKNILRLLLRDGSEYLLDCKNQVAAHDLLRALNEEASNASGSGARAIGSFGSYSGTSYSQGSYLSPSSSFN